MPTTSVIIPTFNRPELLRLGILSSLALEETKDVEVLVLNDGEENDGTEDVCNRFKHLLKIKYFYTGSRNKASLKWRVPGFVINIGVKQCSGDNIIITCPEIYILDRGTLSTVTRVVESGDKTIAITDGKDDYNGHGLNAVKRDLYDLLPSMYDSMFHLHTEYPFFMCIKKSDFVAVGGYDEDFIGYAYDDTNFTLRLRNYGAKFVKLKNRIIHLHHPRGRNDRPGVIDYDKEIEYNKNLYHKKDKDIKANEGREWGVLQ